MSPVIIIILGTILIAGIFWMKSLPAHRRRFALFKLLILLLIAIIVILTITGRLHWIGALLASFFLLFKKYNFIFRALPFLQRFFKKSNFQKSKTTQKGSLMSRQEALDILGLKEGCSSEDIILAHRKLMQRLHPDQGGSDYLAAQINEARALLLNK
ncbi:hypothetical protein [Neptunomonas sp.]|uniref:hypothetical protein n=1 Tax=Neptunomonas sp. TaxID=1971898 RepID=UPI0025EF9228|nr:hypothetical protein [Neptunomonas sp.]